LLHAQVERSLLISFSLTSFVALLGGRLLVLAALAQIRRPRLELQLDPRARHRMRGSRAGARASSQRALGNPRLRLSRHDPSERGLRIEGSEVLATLDDFEAVLASNAIDEVAIALPEISADALGELIAVCEREASRRA